MIHHGPTNVRVTLTAPVWLQGDVVVSVCGGFVIHTAAVPANALYAYWKISPFVCWTLNKNPKDLPEKWNVYFETALIYFILNIALKQNLRSKTP